MIVRRVVPAGDAGSGDARPRDADIVDTESPDARDRLRDWYRPETPTSIRLMMIGTLDGRAAGNDGTSESLTSRLDRMILGLVREWADLVVVGAESVRREGYLLPRRSRLAIVSASGNLEGHRLDRVAAPSTSGLVPPPVLVLTTAAGRAAAQSSLGAVPHEIVVLAPHSEGQLPIGDILQTLRDHGGEHIVCEGGPSLAAQFLAEGLVDEVCLTVAPKLGGAELPLLGSGATPSVPLRVRQLLMDDEGAQYGRWVPEEPSSARP